MNRSSTWMRATSLSLAMLIAMTIGFLINVNDSAAWTAPTLDGRLDDVYLEYGTVTRYADTSTHSTTNLDNHPAAYLYVIEDATYVYVFYHQDTYYANDNSYGENSIHWESRKNGKRNFFDIVESDMGEFTFKDAAGTVVAHFYVDQLAEDSGTPSGYTCGGFGPNSPDAAPWNDGNWLTGDTADQVHFEMTSVMAYNLNVTGYCTGGSCSCGTTTDLLADSPLASDTYETTDAGCSNWQWYNGWEMRVNKAVFDQLGFGVVIGNHHNSPTKTCAPNESCDTELILPLSSIGDRVWHDLDGDGAQDGGEPGLQGVTVKLIDPRGGSTVETQVTNSQGEYLFEDLSHSYYIVQVDEGTLPAGYSSTTALGSPTDYHSSYINNICGADCIQRDGKTYTNIYYIYLTHPEDYRAADFGYKPSGAAIGDYVWSDADNDGMQDLGEPGIQGVLVELLDESEVTILDTTTTDYAGYYMFYGLTAGSYKVRVAASNFNPGGPLDGYSHSPGPESSNSPTATITLATNEVYNDADFGYYKAGLGSIGDLVWFDVNNDEDWTGEDGAEGVTLALYLDLDENGDLDPTDPFIADSMTNASGIYSFTGLTLDQHYLVKVTDSEGVLYGFNITTYWGDDPGEPTINRYNNPAPVELTTGAPTADWADFGYNRSGSIGDTVFYDWNQNQVQDPGELGVSGVTVDLSGQETDSATTADDGTYLFTELSAGDYNVTITVPSGWTLTTGMSNPHPVTLAGNDSYLDADFGIYRDSGAYTLGDLVWHDIDTDGYRDDGEPGIGNVTVDLYLDSNEDGELGASEPLLNTVTTDNSEDYKGAYTFYGLLDGYYIVLVSDNYGELSGYAWTDGLDDTNNHSQETPYPVTISGASIYHADFGYDPNPTWASIASFDAYVDKGRVVVAWETASEVGTVGFNLYRVETNGDSVLLNANPIPGLMNAPQGGFYSYVDPGATPGRSYTYKLVEMDALGDQRVHGPYAVKATSQAARGFGVPIGASFQRLAHQTNPHRRPPLPSALFEEGMDNEETVSIEKGSFRVFLPVVNPGNIIVIKTENAAKVAISETGMYYLTAEDIAPQMDLNTQQVKKLIEEGRLELTNQGNRIAYAPDHGNNGIFFYGEGIDSSYTRENVYWISDGQALLIDTIEGVGPDVENLWVPYVDRIHHEEEHYAALGLFNDPEKDFWLWDFIISGMSGYDQKSFSMPLNGADPSGTATLTVNLLGGLDNPQNPDHHAVVSLNGTVIGETRWDGINAKQFDITFDQSLLNDSENTIEVLGVLDSGVPQSFFYIDSFELRYHRYYQAIDDALYASGEDYSVVTVQGYSEPEIFVFDVTNPSAPKWITATTIDPVESGYQISFEPPYPDSQFAVLTREGLMTPLSLVADNPSNLKSAGNAADYLVIAPSDLMQSAQGLASYRQGTGYIALVVDLVDIYDEFNFGIASPEAIRDFLSYAYHNWSTSPRYVTLAGEGTVDYKDNLGYGDNLVPPFLVGTPYGLFAADNAFADVAGNDGLADIAIGRLPVHSQAELEAAIARIKAYESSSGAWQGHVLMTADDPDSGGNFPADSDDLSALVASGYSTTKIYLSESSLADARLALINELNSGAALMNFIGHAGNDRLSEEGLLRTSDLGSLTNGGKLPIVTALTCVVGRFEIPGVDSLGEALTLDGDGGAIAVWAPTGLSLNRDAKALGESFFQAAFQDGKTVLGDVVLFALNENASIGDTFSLLEVYTLLGDPGLQLKLKPIP
ncbi:MAG: hypothetical protein GTO18_19450 [Anaerolineales bacterium]|nr:hypothetical protein [Anaerolineales bacterium]